MHIHRPHFGPPLIVDFRIAWRNTRTAVTDVVGWCVFVIDKRPACIRIADKPAVEIGYFVRIRILRVRPGYGHAQRICVSDA